MEDGGLLFGCDADAGVPDDQVHVVGGGVAMDLQADAAAVGGEFDGVVEEPLQDLDDAVAVADDRRFDAINLE